jgi:peroxiredoxin
MGRDVIVILPRQQSSLEGANMRGKFIYIVLVAFTAMGFWAACKGGSPTTPPPPANITFRGSITSGGAKLSGVPVYLSQDVSKSAVTDANGEFSFTGISGSEFVITPSLTNTAFSPSNYELGSQSRTDLVFTVQPASFGSTVGAIAANFSASNQSGGNTSLYQLFGKVILIDFSADWCGPCRDEAGRAEALYQAYKGKGFEMMTILISGSPALWASTYNLTFPVLDDTSTSLWAVYGEGYIPLNIVLDRNMTIRYKAAGYDEAAITAVIKKYL